MARILIVDDEYNSVNILKLMLEQAGYDIIIAGNGQQALDLARCERPDMIITDVLMPVMDGYTFYKELKEDSVTKNIPVIVLSARGAMESAFEAVGVDYFLEKPVERQALMEAITMILDRPNRCGEVKKHQRVLVAGTYCDVVDDIAQFAQGLGHDIIKVYTAADVLRKSIDFKEDVLILDVQMEGGAPSSDIIKAVRILPEFQAIPILLYSYYRVSDLGSNDFRQRILNIERAKDACMDAGATAYFDRYNPDVFQEWVVKYI